LMSLKWGSSLRTRSAFSTMWVPAMKQSPHGIFSWYFARSIP